MYLFLSVTKEGVIYEGNYFIQLRQRFKDRHPHLKTEIDLSNCHYDVKINYKWCRENGSEPCFDYNTGGENLGEEALLKRGYDKNETPFAPCGVLCKPNGYDKEKERVSLYLSKQCLTCPLPVPDPIKDCSYLENECGYSTHMSIRAYPRLVSEIPRCSDRWKKIRNLRSTFERSNGTCKSSDLDILDSPRIYGLSMASIEAT